MYRGDRIILVTPDNARLDGQPGVIAEMTPWGAHVDTPAAATGRFRALYEEMRVPGVAPVRQMGYTGNVCNTCGGSRMRRNGSCEVCEECGATSGCG